MDVTYKIEIETPDGDVEIEVSVEDGDLCISMEDKGDGDMVAVALSDEQIDNLVKAIFAAKAYKKSLQGKTKKDTPTGILLKVGDKVLLSNGHIGTVIETDSSRTYPYRITWMGELYKGEDWFSADDEDKENGDDYIVSLVD